MIRRLLAAVIALGLLVACSPDKSAVYKQPTPKSSATTTTLPLQERLAQTTDCKVLTAMAVEAYQKIPDVPQSDNPRVTQAKMDYLAVLAREGQVNCQLTLAP